MTDTKGMILLLVEDDPVDAELALKVFSKLGIEKNVVLCSDGVQALDSIFPEARHGIVALEYTPKVIFLDLKLPRVDGIEVLRRVKSDHRTKTTPIVILTSSREQRDIDQCYDLGANSYVVKPVNAEQYERALSTMTEFWMNINESQELKIQHLLATP